MSNIEKAYEKIRQFNEIAGNLNDVTDDSIDAQISFIFSELTETIDGFEAGNRVEILDGACDLFVTVSGLMQKLEAQGYDVMRALDRVNENNLSKFPATLQDAEYVNAQSNGWKIIYNDKYSKFVIKDEKDKIRKPVYYFKDVYLADLLPKRGA